ELGVVGLMNVQLAYQDGKVYVIEVNPRASRTVPFVSKAIGSSLAKIAARCMAGKSLEQQNFLEEVIPPYFAVKESVFPFNKFQGVDPILGPEMKSTGEVMGVGDSFDEAFAKAALAAGERLPEKGTAFISVREADKSGAAALARDLQAVGFRLVATAGTAAVIREAGIEVETVNKVREGRPHIVDAIKNGQIQLIINTTEGRKAVADSSQIRQSALQHKVTYTTTLAGGEALCRAIKFGPERTVRRLQDLHAGKSA
ncbi:MAG: carbamoyl phosphate synthase large subunit, partial [Gammaproteobacteria bacterium]|nr:carbamoyl phosphate synthase large subunit [Gammaproteobacteria bacterium]